MALAIFDLDKTLINGDSDFLWGEFMSEIGAVDKHAYQIQNQYFFDQYGLGKLDINEYLRFCLKPLSNKSITTLNIWHQDFMRQKIENILLPKAQMVVDKHKAQGETILVITATNRFVSTPIVSKYGIDNLLATNLEIKNGKYTGNISGDPCFKYGKVKHLQKWLAETGEDIKGSSFYSDSYNDLPMLELVDNPKVVHADDKLKEVALQRDWEILNWL